MPKQHDETTNSGWCTVSHHAKLKEGFWAAQTAATIDTLEVILLGAGECLIDNVVKKNNSNSTNHIFLDPINQSLESGAGGWKAEGTHALSSLETRLGLGGVIGSSNSFHIRATDRGDYLANRVTVPLTNRWGNLLPMNYTDECHISAEVHWLRGHPEILLRLRGNYLEADGKLNLANSWPYNYAFGTPGARNSVTPQNPNTGPAIYDVTYAPVLPRSNAPVVVTARFDDPDGLLGSSPQAGPWPVLRYRYDSASSLTNPSLTNILMRDDGLVGDLVAGDGLFSATIPSPPEGSTMAAFRIEAADNAPSPLTNRFPVAKRFYANDQEQGECLVAWNEPKAPGALGTYRLWMTQSTLNQWVTRGNLDNADLNVALVYGDQRAIHNAGAHYSGSPVMRPRYDTPTNSSYAPPTDQPKSCGFSINLPSDDSLLGSSTAHFEHSNFADRSCTAEQAAYWLEAELGIPSLHRRYALLYVNGVEHGFISEESQAPDSDFLDAWFPGDSDGDLYKLAEWKVGSIGCLPDEDDRGGFDSINATLEKFPPSGDASERHRARYRWIWEKRASGNSVNDYDSLFALIETVNTIGGPDVYAAQFVQLVDADEWMRVFALARILSNDDQYGYGGGQNMYAYKPQAGKWKLIPYDLDYSFSTLYTAAHEKRPLELFERYYDPVLPRIMYNPTLQRAYWRAILDIVNGPFQTNQVSAILLARYNALRSNGVPWGTGNSRLGPPPVLFVDPRRQEIFSAAAAVTVDFTLAAGGGTTTNNPMIFSGTAPVNVTGIAVNNVGYPIIWATPTNWQIAVPLMSTGQTDFAFTATDAKGLQVGGSLSANVIYSGDYLPGTYPCLNEWMVKNTWVLCDPADGTYKPWIEIYNPNNAALDLSNFQLRKYPGGPQNFTGWTAPSGSIIPPGGFQLVWADGQTNQNGRNGSGGDLHAGFTLIDNDTVALYASDTTNRLDSVSVGVTSSNVSYGRYPDGQGTNVVVMSIATPRVANTVVIPPTVSLIISEWMALNTTNHLDPADNNYDPWVEIYNAGTNLVDLTGYSLTDDTTTPQKWLFPPGTMIAADGYLALWADAESHQYYPGAPNTMFDSQIQIHTNFRLNSATGAIGLFDPAGNSLDTVSWSSLSPDVSYGRCGTNIVQLATPTPGAPNQCP